MSRPRTGEMPSIFEAALWSRHGLGVATSALQTAAETLKTTAATLHDLRSHLED